MKIFLILLWYITVNEFVGFYATKNDFLIYIDENGVKYNLWMTNLLYTILFPIGFYIYHKAITNIKYKQWIYAFFIIFLFSSAISYIFYRNFVTQWSEWTFIIGSLLLVISIIFYFLELLKSDKLILFHRTLLFWISIGLLLFHVGTIPLFVEINGYALFPGTHSIFLITYLLAIGMYLIFTFGFIWSRKE